MNYQQIKDLYEAGLITKTEANQHIDWLNMGSDTMFYQPITGPEYK